METQLLEKKKPKLWTKAGLQTLGDLICAARKNLGLSQRGITALIQERTGCYVSDTSLSDIERGGKEPKWNTLAAIAAAEFVKKLTNEPYTVEEFAAIASESFFCSEVDVTSNEEFFPVPTFKAARRLKNLIAMTSQRRGWSEVDFLRIGIEPDFYQAAATGDWLQAQKRIEPVKQQMALLATYLYKARHWDENDIPELRESCYQSAEEFWTDLETRNGDVIRHC